MSNPDFGEIYRQRYETFRHLDKLRWQMLQIGIAAGSIVLAFGNGAGRQPYWWTWTAVGMVLLLSGVAMMRIGKGIRSNSTHLHKAAVEVGDDGIPEQSPWYWSVAAWIAIAMILAGLVSLYVATKC